MPNRYHENSQGDFYVECDVCTSCGAPQAEAPDLIDHSKTYYSHCYFKKQPETEEEIKIVHLLSSSPPNHPMPPNRNHIRVGMFFFGVIFL